MQFKGLAPWTLQETHLYSVMKWAEFDSGWWIIEGCEVKILQLIAMVPFFYHRREIKIAHRQGEGSQAGRLKQIMVDISAAVLLRRWVPCSRTQVEPTLTLNVQNVTRRWAVWDNFFADDVVLLRVTSRHQRHRTLIFLSSLSSRALPPPLPLDSSFSSYLTLLLLSINGRGRRRKEEGGWKESIWWLFHPPCCSASNINNHFELFTNCRSALRRLEWAVTRWHKCMYARARVIDFGGSCCVHQAIQSRDHLTGQSTWLRKLIIATKLFSIFFQTAPNHIYELFSWFSSRCFLRPT